MYCQTIKYTNTRDDSIVMNFGVFNRYGLEYVGTNQDGEIIIRDTCIQYDGVGFDAKWKTVKAFAIIAPIFGGVLCFWTWVGVCFYKGKPFWQKAGIVFLITCFFQGLTLLFLQSNACHNNPTINNVEGQSGVDLQFNDECERDWGYNCVIASVVLWFASAVAAFAVPPARRPERGPPETQTVTYTETTQPDGTKAVTTEVVKGTYMPEEAKDPEDKDVETQDQAAAE